MAARWLVPSCLLLVCLVTPFDARKSKPRAVTTSATDVEESAPPQFVHRMEKKTNVNEAPGMIIVLPCLARGNPKPTIRWLRGGQPLKEIEVGEGKRYRIKKWKLKIFDAQPTETDNYTCIVENEFGRTSWVFNVNITEPDSEPVVPVISPLPTNQTIISGRPVRIECIAHTDPAFQKLVTINWYKHFLVDGKAYDPNGEPYTDPIQEEEGRYTFPEPTKLVIQRMQVVDSGWYTCMPFVKGYEHIHSYASLYITVRPGRNVHSSGNTAHSERAPTWRPEVDDSADSRGTNADSDDSKVVQMDSEPTNRSSSNNMRWASGGVGYLCVIYMVVFIEQLFKALSEAVH